MRRIPTYLGWLLGTIDPFPMLSRVHPLMLAPAQGGRRGYAASHSCGSRRAPVVAFRNRVRRSARTQVIEWIEAQRTAVVAGPAASADHGVPCSGSHENASCDATPGLTAIVHDLPDVVARCSYRRCLHKIGEFKAMFARTGLRWPRTAPVNAHLSVPEAVPA